MDVAKHLVQGVDVWLNTPRRPLEASGTSGMKSAANGVLNVSVLDGWWDEAAAERLGWSIGQGEVYDDPDVQDQIESSALYDLLEHEIVPLFYDRGRDGLPRGWIRMMKEALKGLCPVFNTNRMVHEYATRFYLPAVDRYNQLVDDDFASVRALAAWRDKVQAAWEQVRILEIEAPEVTELAVGDTIAVRARVSLGGLEPGDVDVQLYHGEVEPDGSVSSGEAVSMAAQGDAGNGAHWYYGEVPCPTTGRRGYALRVLPRHAALATPFLPGLIRWDAESLGHDWQRAPAGV
jgi:starch phosphorylase